MNFPGHDFIRLIEAAEPRAPAASKVMALHPTGSTAGRRPELGSP